MRSRTASYMQEVYIATDACQQSAEQMGQELRSLNIDAQHQCTLAVAAHSIETAAHLRPTEHDKHHYDYHQCYYHTDFHIGIYIISQLVHRSHPRNEHTCLLQCSEVFIRHIEGLSIYDGGHASGKEHPGQCHDKGLDIQVRYQEALYDTEGKADSNGDQHRNEYIASAKVQVYRTVHTDQCYHATDGDIDPTSDHD